MYCDMFVVYAQDVHSKEPGVREVSVALLPGEERLGLNLVEDSDGTLRVKAIGPGSYYTCVLSLL